MLHLKEVLLLFFNSRVPEIDSGPLEKCELVNRNINGMERSWKTLEKKLLHSHKQASQPIIYGLI